MKSRSVDKHLLPNGLRDLLPPDAKGEAHVVENLLAVFHANGYDRVEPPLLEFEQSLVAGPGKAVSPQMFRLMDPVSQQMMGVRADITPQVARVASTRFHRSARPLRLSYGGQVLRVQGNELRPKRQFVQVGAELIGSRECSADVEVVVLAVEALQRIGIMDICVDLSLPTLVPAVCDEIGLMGEKADRVRIALDRKDPTALLEFSDSAQTLLVGLLKASGLADDAIQALRRLKLSDGTRNMCEELAEIAMQISRVAPSLTLTVDPVEFRGMEYQTGICFTIFTPSVHSEVGRGGRYELSTGEPATGFSLFMDTLASALPAPSEEPRVYVPFGTCAETSAGLRGKGWRTVQALSEEEEGLIEARHQECSHIFQDGIVVAIG